MWEAGSLAPITAGSRALAFALHLFAVLSFVLLRPSTFVEIRFKSLLSI